MKPIFILSQPRSGSTLLQRLVNSFAGTIIHGEHAGLLIGIADSFRRFFHRPRTGFREGDKKSVLQNLKNPKAFCALDSGLTEVMVKELFRGFILRLINPFDLRFRCGFKEVRYGLKNDFVFEMLQELFPSAKFVFTVRHPVEQIARCYQCGWFWRDCQSAIENWKHQFTRFQDLVTIYPNQCRMVRYEQFAQRDEHLIKVFEWLDLPWGRTQTRILFDLGKIGVTANQKPVSDAFKSRVLSQCGKLWNE